MKKAFLLILVLLIIYVLITILYPLSNQIHLITSPFISSSIPQTVPEVNRTPEYSSTILDKIVSIQKASTKLAILQNTYQGEIVQIEKLDNTSLPYVLSLTIKASDDIENTFLFTEKEVSIMQVFKEVNSKKTIVPLNDLSKEDVITIYEQIDLQKTFSNARMVLTITIKE